MRRNGRPGLLRTMGRTAVVAGTASATANAVNRRAHERGVEQQQAAAFRASQDAPPPEPPAAPAPPTPAPAPVAAPAPPAAGSTDELVAHLTSLGALHDAGVLTDEEFGAAKARLLTR